MIAGEPRRPALVSEAGDPDAAVLRDDLVRLAIEGHHRRAALERVRRIDEPLARRQEAAEIGDGLGRRLDHRVVHGLHGVVVVASRPGARGPRRGPRTPSACQPPGVAASARHRERAARLDVDRRGSPARISRTGGRRCPSAGCSPARRWRRGGRRPRACDRCPAGPARAGTRRRRSASRPAPASPSWAGSTAARPSTRARRTPRCAPSSRRTPRRSGRAASRR